MSPVLRVRRVPLVQPVVAALLASLVVALVSGCGALPGTRTDARPRPPGRQFRHPGVLVSKAQLDTARDRVAAGKEPWLSAYLAMRDSRYGALAYRPQPYATVACPPGDEAGRGCVEERQDAIAAYTHALLWYLTGQRAHARTAERIMDAWSATVRRHTEGNAALQAAWAGSTWARAGEIVRHTGAGWPRARAHRFAAMLRTVYLPEVTRRVPDYNGNWDLVMTDAATGIAVFLDDHRTFRKALARFHARVPAYFYLRSDGPLPATVPGFGARNAAGIDTYWFGQHTFRDGLAQESCRNFMHVGYALAATGHIAETAWHQGIDLYGGVKDRLRAALELHSRYQLGEPAPRWLCGGHPELTLGPDLEVPLNHLANRLHIPLPRTGELARRMRPAGTDGLFVAWETLTNADNLGE
ncbi:alginate lyase family protein [Streptomyces sp. TS71-3]|uniref:alginate lyase family protein n=1 Tax=Streptomyces sp. TS71-3 TaxID=2733862 RepID=UPI001B052187|nr:alginate lyase family protein [Streptomyces sp. TS71-3]GHJ40527.1 hypothetical protein Sm713_61360 [Streptomyces sp. TS71-3]